MNKIQADKAVQKFKEGIIGRFGNNTDIYLFGSVARGKFEPLSDIDIMILINGRVDNALEEAVFDIAYPIELEENVVFGIVVYSKEFWNSFPAQAMPLKRSIAKEGILV